MSRKRSLNTCYASQVRVSKVRSTHLRDTRPNRHNSSLPKLQCAGRRSENLYATSPAPGPLIRFGCPSCGQHISATPAQIGVTAPCPNCKEAVIVPKTSTLPPLRPVPLPRPVQAKFQEKKRYETTVILIDDSVALLDNRKKLTKWTNDFTEARNWLVGELDALHGEQYVAGIFDHQQNRSVLKMNRA
jgi:hypothetical protein